MKNRARIAYFGLGIVLGMISAFAAKLEEAY